MRITADIIDEESGAVGGAKAKGFKQKKVSRSDPDKLSPAISKILEIGNKGRSAKCDEKSVQHKKKTSIPSKRAKISVGKDQEMDAAESNLPPPTEQKWLVTYLSQMKEEIKREIMEELSLDEETIIPQISRKKETDKSNEVIHEGIFCDHCDRLIRGIRYKCGNCSDFDLCQRCENIPNIHNKNHIFLKIRYSVSPKSKQKKYKEASASETTRNMVTVSETSKMNNGTIIQTTIRKPKHLVKTCRVLEAKFLRDETVPDGTVFAPLTQFIKSWRVMNSGTRAWTKDTKLRYFVGSKDLCPTAYEVDVPFIKPGEEGVVSVVFISPAMPGVYQSHWQFCHKKLSFGHCLWCNIRVQATSNEEDKQEPLGLNISLNATNLPEIEVYSEKENDNQRKEVENIAQVLTAVKEEHERGNMVPRKLVVTSHTATPNNTPFDLTPPKSPEPQETTVKELQDTNSTNAEGESKSNDDSDCEDEGSILSLSSCESDTEFVVIPMPRCFNMSESFASSHFQQLTQQFWSTPAPDDDSTNRKSDKVSEALEQSKQCRIHTTSRLPSQETVSQETGVPEVSENVVVEAVIEVVESLVENSSQNKVLVSRLSVDGSSSEISIIESDDSSPSMETFPPAIETMKIVVPKTSESEKVVGCENSNLLIEPAKTNEKLVNEAQDEADVSAEATFPKFPVEGIEAEPIPRLEERTVQVLPEGLLTGALSAAATVYNTARAVISSMQHPRNEQEYCLSQEFEATNNQTETPAGDIPHPRELDPMQQLIEMGFCNRQLNEQYLQKHKGDLALVVADLVNLSDNDWYASRHTPPCTNFD